jgi:heme exporter protein B
MLQAIWLIVAKDFAIERRSRQMLTAMLVFSILVILIFNFALELDARARLNTTAGILWATFAFAGTLGLNRSMALEAENKSMDGLLTAPIERSAIFFGKFIGNLLFMVIVEAITLPIYSVLYNVNLFEPRLLGVLLLGSIGYAGVGTLLSSMAVQTRTRDLLLPVLLFPIVIPLLVAAVRASSGILNGSPIDFIFPAVNLMIVFDLVMIALAYMFFDYIVEE